ncbi:hypothetical protein SCLARK_001562 [Spiroplasma clarkii]|uniref:hypothetical protein n=1 Tax=Spiroplasma clarkii TaxID=2139 RepID=UPI000B57B72A|nr:hypothetical protein [Spiroplasma clarkii]ARU92066.1 hypothetical protein SCLARK_001562 [Spiroplasma clarkii]
MDTSLKEVCYYCKEVLLENQPTIKIKIIETGPLNLYHLECGKKRKKDYKYTLLATNSKPQSKIGISKP